MPLSDIANIQISVSGAGPARAGFGEPLIAAVKTPFSSGVREYSNLAGMVADGFAVTDPAYLVAARVFANRPAPTAVKVARRALAYTQVIHLTLLSTSNLDTYSINLRTPGGSYQNVTTPSTGVPATDVATMNTSVTALGIANLTATHTGSTLVLTMTAGKLLDVQPGKASLITLADVTADPGVATDLAAILAADSNWYGLLLDSQSPAEIAAAEAWTESNGPRLFGWNTSDSACGDPSSTTDIMYTSKAAGYARSFGLFSQNTLLSWSAAGWMGNLFPTDAGSENWAMKTLPGVTVDVLTDTQIHACENKNGSVYTSVLGVSITQFGKTPSGEFIDITRGIDGLTNDLQVGVVALQVNSLKVPFTDAGIDQYRAVIAASLKRFTDRGFLDGGAPQDINLPKAAQVSPIDRAARNLTGASFSAKVAGAINSLTLNGVLTQ